MKNKISKADFNYMIQEAKEISISNFQSAEVGLINLHENYFGPVTTSFKNEVRSQISKVYQVTDEIIRTTALSILHRKAKVFFPEQSLEGWSIDTWNIGEVMMDFDKDCNNEEICKGVYDNNIHTYRGLHAGLLKLLKLSSEEYEELKDEHEFHTEHVEGCRDCECEYIDDTREVAGLNYDYEHK